MAKGALLIVKLVGKQAERVLPYASPVIKCVLPNVSDDSNSIHFELGEGSSMH